MNRKLHVGNLPLWVTDKDLVEKFGRFGTVEFAAIMQDDVSGASRGIGLVEMASSAEAQKAMSWLNFSSYEGQIMAVSLYDSNARVH